MKAIKVLSLVIVSLLSLYAVSIQPVKSQEGMIIYILSDGNIDSSGVEVPIQRDGNVYTFTDNIMDYPLVIQCNDIIIDGAGFTISRGEDAVIDLSYISNVTIKNMQITGAGYYGIKITGSSGVVITGTSITGITYGIFLSNTTQSAIAENTIGNNFIGVYFSESSSNDVITNKIENNDKGIQLSMSSNSNEITSNDILNNSEGILFSDSSMNTIASNNVTNNDVGIGFSSASSNLFKANYFVANSEQVHDESMDNAAVNSSMNFWSFAYPMGGNYWSDYTGVDVKSGADQDQDGSDGIGDTPYIMYGYNYDEYPLLAHASPPAISIFSPENKTYTVDSVSLTFAVNRPTSWTAYSLDGQATEENPEGKTLEGLTDGSHYVTFYVRDEDGLENSATVYFTVAEGAEPPQSGSFPTTWIVVIAVIAVAGVVLLVYFMRIKKKRPTEEPSTSNPS